MDERQLCFIQLDDVGGVEQVGDESGGVEAWPQVQVVQPQAPGAAATRPFRTERASEQDGNNVPW